MQRPIQWVHEDCLSPATTLWQRYPETPALFVCDDHYWQQEEYSLKRITFIYEALLDLPVQIHRGDTVAQVLAFAQHHQADGILVMETINPYFLQVLDQLAGHYSLQIGRVEPFLDRELSFDLKRFSRYWRQAQKHAFG